VGQRPLLLLLVVEVGVRVVKLRVWRAPGLLLAVLL
jgi:hypothetical protein